MRWNISFVVLSLLIAAALVAASFVSQPAANPDTPSASPVEAIGQLRARFHQDDFAMIVATAPLGLFEVPTMQELRALVDALDKTRLCKTVVQFLDLPVPTVTQDETVVEPLVPALPTGATEAAALRGRVLTYGPVQDGLVNAQGTAALLACPLARPAAWEEIVHFVNAYHGPVLRLVMSGGRGVDLALAQALRTTAFVLVVAALGVFVAVQLLQRRDVQIKPRMAFGVLLLATLVWLIRWQSSANVLDLATGGAVARAQHAVGDMTNADVSVLLDVGGDMTTAGGLAALQRFCESLRVPQTRVSCPSDVLAQAAAAMTGEEQLPSNDEQARNLWFLIGDTAELGLLFSPRRDHVMVRAQPAIGSAVTADDISQRAIDGAKREGLSVSVSGLPFVIPWLSRLLSVALGIGIGLLVLAYLVGRRRSWSALRPMGLGWLAAGVLSPVGAIGLALSLLGAGLVLLGTRDGR